MKRLLYIILLLATSMVGFAQERTVQNRPYTDLRPFHFGVMVGTHLQDLEIVNTGPQMVDLGDGNGPVQKVISVDQDRWDAGFTVGVLGELRLNTTFQLRIAPTMYFGTRQSSYSKSESSSFNNLFAASIQRLSPLLTKSAYIKMQGITSPFQNF